MKGTAIGFSDDSEKLLLRLLKTEFVDQIYLASSCKLKLKVDSEIPKISSKDYLKNNWQNINLLIFIGSIGASLRLINPFLVSKDKDPGVIVIDKKCSKIIPIVGAHQSNGRNIAIQIANLFGGEVVDTSSSSNEDHLNLDSFGSQWGWNRSGSIDDWSKLVIMQSRRAEISYQQSSGNDLWQQSEITKTLTKERKSKDSSFHIGYENTNYVSWHPPTLWIGIGCERNTGKQLIEKSLNKFLKSTRISPLAIAGLATVEIKKDEKSLLKFSDEKKWPIKFFSISELSKIDVPNPSQVVLNEIGTPSVAEAACIKAAGEGSELIQEKIIFKGQTKSKKEFGAVTFAVASSKYQFAPNKGAIHIIGSGPGDLSYLTNDARKALSSCAVWIGYKMYLELLRPLKRNEQIIINSNLTEEKERCEKAIRLAQEGIKVALVSSGDAGFYGMAGLFLELIEKIDFKFRPSFEIHPGISSMQLAASISGAPLMNDFCSISLSDKLTPWKIILKRIEGAILGDFVVVLFNPQSKERNWQLGEAIKLLLNHRNANTPVLIARQVGRDKQTKKFCTLQTIPIKDIDMLTIIIVGNSQTKLLDNIFVTPRGYL